MTSLSSRSYSVQTGDVIRASVCSPTVPFSLCVHGVCVCSPTVPFSLCVHGVCVCSPTVPFSLCVHGVYV